MNQKKLMVLGASVGQLPLITTAVDLGLYVITVDYIPDNVGHQFSHQYVNCSTVDREKVLDHARELKVDGIITFASDVATSTVGYISEELGLPGVTLDIAQTMSNKSMFRKFQLASGLNQPGFMIGRSMDEIESDLDRFTPPLMFKPVDTSGSRGISRVDIRDFAMYRKAFDYALGYSRSNSVCVEEFIVGEDVSGDGFLVNGKASVVVTKKYKRAYVPTGHSLPTHLPADDQDRIVEEVEATCRELGYLNGPVDFDVEVSPERVVVIEISPRLGGNGIPKLIKRSTNIDLIEATVHYALGEPVSVPGKLECANRCGSWVFGSEKAGRLVRVASRDEVQALVPEVFEYQVNFEVGENVPGFDHSGNSMGYALFDCPPQTPYSDVVGRLKRAMQVEITPTE
jgi:biotin carboxylase